MHTGLRRMSTRIVLVLAVVGCVCIFTTAHSGVARASSAGCTGYSAAHARYMSGYGYIVRESGNCYSEYEIQTSSGLWIFWTPQTSAHIVYGAIAQYYITHDYPVGSVRDQNCLGYPTSDEQELWLYFPVIWKWIDIGRYNSFQYGQIDWSRSDGHVWVNGGRCQLID